MIRKLLDLSSKHLPPELGMDGLNTHPGVLAYRITYGWLVWVPNDPGDSPLSEPPPAALLNVQRYARHHGCDYILFDADGDTIDGLPTWSW